MSININISKSNAGYGDWSASAYQGTIIGDRGEKHFYGPTEEVVLAKIMTFMLELSHKQSMVVMNNRIGA